MNQNQVPDNDPNSKGPKKIGDYLSEYLEIFKGTVERYRKIEKDPFRMFTLLLVWTAIIAIVTFKYYDISLQIVTYFFWLIGGTVVLAATRK